MKTRSILCAAVLPVLLSGTAIAQTETMPPVQAGAYDMTGSIRAGYRIVSVNPGDNDGDWFQQNAENLLHEQYNLTDSGFALGKQLPLSLDLYASQPPSGDGFFDQLFVNVDINPTVQGGEIRLRQFGGYDFRLGYKNVDYFFDRYDSLFRDLRRYETNRGVLTSSLGIALNDFLDIGLSYRGIGHGGTQQMPRPMFIEGATGLASWMGVSRLYYLTELPRTDWNNDFSGSLMARFDPVDIVVGGGLTSFTEDYRVTGLTGADSLSLAFRDTNNTAGGFANSFGIVGDQTARERLHEYSHTEDREISGPYVFGQAVVRAADILRITANVRFEMLEGTTGVETFQIAEARKSNAARAFQLYRGSYAGDVTTEFERLRASVAATVIPIPDLSVTAGWKMRRDDHTSNAEYRLAFDSTTSLTEVSAFRTAFRGDSLVVMDWEQRTLLPDQTFFGSVTYAPVRELTLSAGVRATMRTPEVTRSEDAVLDSVITNNMSKETNGLGFDIGASYRPMPELRVRGRFELMQREAEFSEDPFAGGPAAGTVTDLEPRTAPEDRLRFNASVDWQIVENFTAGVRFGLQDASSDLNESMWVVAGSEPVELVDDQTTLSGLLTYRLDDNTTFRLLGETRSSSFSIPMTFTRGQEVVTPLFGVDPTAPPSGSNEFDSSTVVFSQETNDLYIDFGFDARIIEQLTLGAGVSYLAVTGEPITTPEVKNLTGTPTRQGDVTRVGGPFNRLTVNGDVGFDITEQFGVFVSLMYAVQNEEELIDEGVNVPRRFYGFEDYSGLSMLFGIAYQF